MDNSQMPLVQPQQLNTQPLGYNGSVTQQVQNPITQSNDASGLVKTIVIVAVSLIAVTFIGLFIWMLIQYNSVSDDVQGQIDVAVAAAKDEQAQKDEMEFSEREKYPYKTFSGPADYGQLTFEYPKTWSVYVAADASNGGDFSAYFNPVQVNAVSNNTINALRVTILDKSFEEDVEISIRRSFNQMVEEFKHNQEKIKLKANENNTKVLINMKRD